MPDVFKILKDLELKAVGLDESSNKMQEGYFVSFRTVGLPIHKEDFLHPYSPLGSTAAADDTPAPAAAADPATAPKTASAQMDENKVAAAKISQSMQAFLNTFLLVDDKLQMNSQYEVMPSSGKVSDSWWAIITGANGIPTDSVLNDSMKAAYDAARAKLIDADGNPTPHYQAYMEREDEYKDAVRAWNKAYAAAFTDPARLQQWPIEGKTYHDDADEMMDRWTSFGFKEEVESAIATLAAQGTDPAIALISRAKKKFNNSLLEFQNVGQIPYTVLLPNSWADPDNDDGWNEYTSSDFHTESHYQASSTSYGGGGGFSVGFWSAGASFDHSDAQSSLNIQTDDLEVSFSYCAVDIKRPWLDSSLLNLQNWFLMGDYKANCISDGTMGQHVPEKSKEQTFLPSVVTSLILIKDLHLKWGNFKADWAAHEETNSASVSVGWGPFAVQGHYSHHNEQRDFEADATGEELVVPGIQLIGYVSMINPASPAKNSSDFLQKADAPK